MSFNNFLKIICASFIVMMISCDDTSNSNNQDLVDSSSETSLNETEVPVSNEETDKQESSKEEENGSNVPTIGKYICSESGYAWESVSQDIDIYTVILFNGNEFKMAAYTMNGSTNPKEFTRQFDFAGTWEMISEDKVEGTFSDTGKKIEWTFNDDYTSLVNDNGIKFNKVQINN